MKVELGKCPYCGFRDYQRLDQDWNDDTCRVYCSCSNCHKEFIEYFALDEVKFDKDEEEFILNNTLSEQDKKTLLFALDLLVEKQQDTIDHTRIYNILRGELNRE